MIISRTPYRVSLLGGGTDYPSHYRIHGGKVLSFTINKYCYILLRKLPDFFPFKNKVIYSKVECTQTVEEIQHPVVREALKYYQTEGIELFHHADIPAGGGLGSSSAFTVGMVNVMYNFTGGYTPHPKLLASEAIHIERNLLNERVGNQDQVAVAFGGLNKIEFFLNQDEDFEFEVSPILVPLQKVKNLERHLLLFFTGVTRKKIASEVAKTYDPEVDMRVLTEYVDAGIRALQNDNPVLVGELLERSWEHKKRLSPETTNPQLDELYLRAKKAGAVGGKLLGAGGGGFFLFCVPPEKTASVMVALRDLVHIPFSIEFSGSQIILS